MVVLKVPLKLRYGSRLPLRCLRMRLVNRCQSWVTFEPPRSIGTSTKGKTIRVPHEDTRHRVSNNTIKTYAMGLKSYITHNGKWQTLESHNSENLKCGSELQDWDERFRTTKLWLWMPECEQWLWTRNWEMNLNAKVRNVALNTKTETNDFEQLNYGSECLTVSNDSER